MSFLISLVTTLFYGSFSIIAKNLVLVIPVKHSLIISGFSPKMFLKKIHSEVVNVGYEFCGIEGPVDSRADSFVLESNVHFPSDTGLMLDGISSLIRLVKNACQKYGLPGWREHKSLFKKIKRLRRLCQLSKKSTSKKDEVIAKKQIEQSHLSQDYATAVAKVIAKAQASLAEIKKHPNSLKISEKIEFFIAETKKASNQLIRRVVNGEKIPHSEKTFSLHESYTEWISKGKAGVAQELGVRVAIVEGDKGFILHWNTMFNNTDDKIAVSLMEETKALFPTLKSGSFDKGFYTPQNGPDLKKVLDVVILPKKGKMNAEEKAEASTPEYRHLRSYHSRIESAINCLENHGLDRCRDKGKDAFENYVALAVVARNILQIGLLVREKLIREDQARIKRLSLSTS